jgi:predicted dinucleotide-binding enzyme
MCDFMKIGVLGTGDVGFAIATKLIQIGNDVMVGSRTADNKKAIEWKKANGPRSSNGTFSDAADFGEIVFNCTSGAHSLDALRAAGENNLKNKIIVDVANALDFSKGMPPSLLVCNTDSLGEQIQRAFSKAKVVKTLNTVNYRIMVNPKILPEDHTLFICGNDDDAKAKVNKILKEGFGWKSVIDLGDIKSARGTEMFLPMWLMIATKLQYADFNLKIVTK